MELGPKIDFARMKKIIIYVVYHDQESYRICYNKLHRYAWARFVMIKTTKYCESIFLEYLLEHQNEWTDSEFVGMITYSFAKKIPLSTLLDAVNGIEEGRFKDVDLIGLRRLKLSIGDNAMMGIQKHLVAIMMKPQVDIFGARARELESFKNIEPLRSVPLEPVSITTKDLMERARQQRTTASRAARDILHSYHSTVTSRNNLNGNAEIARSTRGFGVRNLTTYTCSCQNVKTRQGINKQGINLDPHIERITPFYSNYWLARPSILLSYLRWAKIVREIIDNDPEISKNLSENSNYKIESEKFRPIFGHPWMTWHPFLMERMICIYAYFARLRIFTYETSIPLQNDRQTFGTAKN